MICDEGKATMPRGSASGDTLLLLKHIHSLRGVATVDEIGGMSAVDKLLKQGLIRQVWISNYALTDKGKQMVHGKMSQRAT